MEGRFGVFDGATLIAEFSDDESADEYRRDLLQERLPEHLRTPEYDFLEVREIPDDYDAWRKLLHGLQASLRGEPGGAALLKEYRKRKKK